MTLAGALAVPQRDQQRRGAVDAGDRIAERHVLHRRHRALLGRADAPGRAAGEATRISWPPGSAASTRPTAGAITDARPGPRGATADRADDADAHAAGTDDGAERARAAAGCRRRRADAARHAAIAAVARRAAK